MVLIPEVISGVSEFLGFEMGAHDVVRRGYEGDKHLWRDRKLAKSACSLRHDSLAVLKESLSFYWTDFRRRIFFENHSTEFKVRLLCDKNNWYFT
jgi:hypothetical protein